MVVKMVVRPIAKLSETLIRSRLVHRRGLSDAPSMTPYSYRWPDHRGSAAGTRPVRGRTAPAWILRTGQLLSGLGIDIDGFSKLADKREPGGVGVS